MVNKIEIYYFSGTGNARQIAEWWAECAKEKNVDCPVHNIVHFSNGERPVSDDATIAFISPVHGFNYPPAMLKFICRFPQGKNRVVLMNTRAGIKVGKHVTIGLTGVAFYVSALILRLKGYRISGMIPFDMPSNWFLLHPAMCRETVNYIFEKNKERVKNHAGKIFADKNDFYALREIVQDILIAPVALAYYLTGRFFLAKTFYASCKCTNCGTCVKQCPVGAVRRVQNKPFWTLRCESCMHCIKNCPHDAVEIAHGLAFALIFAGTVTLSFLSDFLPAIFENRFLHFVYKIIVFFVLLLSLYFVQHILLKNKYLSAIITFFSLSHYKWWGKRNSTTGKDSNQEKQYFCTQDNDSENGQTENDKGILSETG